MNYIINYEEALAMRDAMIERTKDLPRPDGWIVLFWVEETDFDDGLASSTMDVNYCIENLNGGVLVLSKNENREVLSRVRVKEVFTYEEYGIPKFEPYPDPTPEDPYVDPYNPFE